MPDRLSLFRSAAHAGAGRAQPMDQHQQQHRHYQELQQQQQDQPRDPSAATLGAMPAPATPKCWAVVQTPLETLYDDDEEESEDSGYFNQTGTTAITPVYAETGRRASTASAAGKESATSTLTPQSTEYGSFEARRLGERTGGNAATSFQGHNAPQHTQSEPHSILSQLSLQRCSLHSSTCATEAETGRPPAGGSVDTAPATTGARPGGSISNSSTSSLRPLLRLKTSSSVPNIQSHFKSRTLLRRPRSRNSGKEGLQRETAFWGGDLLSDGDGDDHGEHQSSSCSSVKWPFAKDMSDSVFRRGTVASGGFSSTVSTTLTSRDHTPLPTTSLFPAVGEGPRSKSLLFSEDRGAVATSAFPPSRLTSAGGGPTSVTSVSTLPTQQQQLLTPRSPRRELASEASRHNWQSVSGMRSKTPQQQDISSVSSPQAAEATTSFSAQRQAGISQAPGHLPVTPVTAEQSCVNKDVSKGLPPIRRSLFHPFRKHACVSGEPSGGSCPDFRSTHHTFGSSVSLAKHSVDVTGTRRNSSQLQLLQFPASHGVMRASGIRGSSSGGLPPLPSQPGHSRAGGDLPSFCGDTSATGSALLPSTAYPLEIGERSDTIATKTVTDGARATAATATVAALSSNSSFFDAARRTARNRKAASAVMRAPPPQQIAATKIKEEEKGPPPVAPSPSEKNTELKAASLAVSRLPPSTTFHTNPRNTPAATTGAAAAVSAIHLAGINAPAVAATVPVAPTSSTGLSSRTQIPNEQRSPTAGGTSDEGRTSSGAAIMTEMLQSSVQRIATSEEKREEGGGGVGCVHGLSHTGENDHAHYHGTVSSNNVVMISNSSRSSSQAASNATTGAVIPVTNICSISHLTNGGRLPNNNMKGTGGGGSGVRRSGSFSSLSKKLSIRGLKLRSSGGGSGPVGSSSTTSAAAVATGTSSATGTVSSSTPTSATSTPHTMSAPHININNEEGIVTPSHQHSQQSKTSSLRSEMIPQSPIHALDSLRFNPTPAVLEEEGSQLSRSSSSVGREEAA